MTTSPSVLATPATSNPFRVLSVSRRAILKSLRFMLQNNIQLYTVDEAQISTFTEVIDHTIGKQGHIINMTEMFKILECSGLDIDILSWVWDQATTVTFVTVGLKPNNNETFSREQGIAALYLAQVQSGLGLNEFSRKLIPSRNSHASPSSSLHAPSSNRNDHMLAFKSPSPIHLKEGTNSLLYLYHEQPDLELAQTDLELAQPDLELAQPALMYSKICYPEASENFGVHDQFPELDDRNQVAGANAPEVYDSSEFVQLPNEDTPNQHPPVQAQKVLGKWRSVKCKLGGTIRYSDDAVAKIKMATGYMD